MTPHTHSEYVEGCYRCELSRDEVEGERVRAAAEAGDELAEFLAEEMKDPEFAAHYRIAELTAEVARLQRLLNAERAEIENVWKAEVARLRADLARALDVLRETRDAGNHLVTLLHRFKDSEQPNPTSDTVNAVVTSWRNCALIRAVLGPR